MTTRIKLKKSSVSSNAPSTGDLDYGELAINYADGKLYYKNSSNVIKNFSDSDTIAAQIAAAVAAAGGYNDASVDTHLNTGTANPGEVLSWTGSDYDWVVQSGGLDSAAVITLVDSAYVQLRQDYAYSSLTGTPSIPQSGVDFDPVGTDNSTDVTLAGSYDYLTLSGQQITLNQIDYSTDISNLPNILDSADIAAVAGEAGYYSSGDSAVFSTVTTTGNVVIGGNLQVNGTTVTVNATDLNVTDNMIYMNAGESDGSPVSSIDVGWAANVNDNGSYAHVGMFRDATDDTFKVFHNYTPEPDAAVEINTGHASFALAPFAASTLSGVYLGFDSDFSGKSTTDLTEGTNLYYTSSRVDSDILSYDYTTCLGTVTSVSAGTGLTGGPITTTGSLCLATAGAGAANYTGGISDVNVDAYGRVTSVSGSAGYTTCTGTVTSVTVSAGTGLSGGGTVTTSGTATLNLDFSELTDMTGDISGTTEFILQNGTTESRKAASEIKLSNFNNDAGWTSYDSADTVGLVDSAYVQARQDYAYSSLTGAPNVLDSADVIAIHNAQGGGLDSAAVLGLLSIDNLSDGRSPDATSLGLGTNALANDDGTNNFNIAIGQCALYSNTTGGCNVAVGTCAAYTTNNTYGVTAIGYLAGKSNTTGKGNTLVGYVAGYNIQNGQYNTIMGAWAGCSGTSSSFVTAIGQNSLRNNTVGYSTAVGWSALQNNSTGSGNVAMGPQSLYTNTTGSQNVAFGACSLCANTTGAQNTVIGSSAGSILTTGSNNTLLGYNAEPSSATVSNEITLGDANVTSLRIPGLQSGATTGDVLTYDGSKLVLSAAAGGGGIDSAAAIALMSIDNLSDGRSPDATSIGLGTNAIANDDGSSNFNIAIGQCALYTNVTGSSNVAIGHEALCGLTNDAAAIAIGLRALCLSTVGCNTAIGNASMRNNTTGKKNTAVGFFSLINNSTGADNVVMGHSTACSNTTGCQLVAIGSYGLSSNTSGIRNVAVGYDAMRLNTTGNCNIAIGQSALRSNTCANLNVGIGAYSLYANTTGGCNVAVGACALTLNTDGYCNTAVGMYSMYSNTTGYLNTAVGYCSLGGMTSHSAYNAGVGVFALNSLAGGDYNTAVGCGAGSTLTTGSNNLMLGCNAQPSSATVSNEITLGDTSITSLRIPGLQSGATTGDVLTYDGSKLVLSAAAGGGGGLDSAAVISLIDSDYVRLRQIGALIDSDVPTAVKVGDFWYDKTDGTLNIYYQDSSETPVFVNVAASTAASTAGLDSAAAIALMSIDNLSDGSTAGTRNVALGTNAGTGQAGNTTVGFEAGCNLSASNGDQNVFLGTYAGKAFSVADHQVGIGYGAMCAGTSVPFYNVAVGSWSMKGISGGCNTALGAYSMCSSLGAICNTAVGYSALKNNTTGSNNTAIGASALLSNTIGTDNVAIGFCALYTGTNNLNTYNTAVGSCSMLSNVTGCNNVAVGTRSLQANTIGQSNVAVGVYSLLSNTTGSYNTAIGLSALEANTTGRCNVAIGYAPLKCNITGSENIAFGDCALYTNTTSSGNVAIGHWAMRNSNGAAYSVAVGNASQCSITSSYGMNTSVGWLSLANTTTGAYNTAIGAGALVNNITGSQNVAVGQYAGYNICSSFNVAIGNGALSLTTLGANNSAIGHQSMYSNTTGERNTAVGYYALRGNTIGSSNVAVGEIALCANTTGVCNTAVGRSSQIKTTIGTCNSSFGTSALSCNTTGIQNTAVGVRALLLNSTGSQNTAVGVLAGNDITYGSNNLLLGYNAQPSSATVSNEITLGDTNVDTLRVPGIGTYTLGGSTTTTAITQVALATFPHATYGGGEAIVMATQGNHRHLTKMLIIHDGTSAYATEFGTIYDSAELATFDVDISGSDARILVTPGSTTSTTFKAVLNLTDA